VGSSTFNVARFLKELGVKNVTELPLVARNQPVTVMADLSALTPQHIPASGSAGGFAGNVAGEFGQFQILCLSAGGLFIDAGYMNSAAGGQVWFIFPVDGSGGINGGIPPVLTAGGTVLPFARQSRDLPISEIRFGTSATNIGALNNAPRQTPAFPGDHFINVGPGVIYLEMGSVFVMQSVLANNGISGFFTIREVPASEAVEGVGGP